MRIATVTAPSAAAPSVPQLGPLPKPPEPSDAKRIWNAVEFSKMAVSRLALAKEAFATGGVLGAVGQVEHVVEAVNGLYLNMERLSPAHQQPELEKRALDALIAADDLRLDSMNGKRPEEFLARCDAQTTELLALAELIRAVRFP